MRLGVGLRGSYLTFAAFIVVGGTRSERSMVVLTPCYRIGGGRDDAYVHALPLAPEFSDCAP